MFSFFKRKKPGSPPEEAAGQAPEQAVAEEQDGPAAEQPAPDVPAAAAHEAAQPPAGLPQPDKAEPLAAEAAPAAETAAHEVPLDDQQGRPGVEEPSAVVPGVSPLAAQPLTAPTESVSQADDPQPATADTGKRSWLSRLKQGLARTGQNIGGIFVGVKVDEDLFEELETALIMADAGMEATTKLLTALRARVKKERLNDAQAVKQALCDILAEHLKPLEKPFPLDRPTPAFR